MKTASVLALLLALAGRARGEERRGDGHRAHAGGGSFSRPQAQPQRHIQPAPAYTAPAPRYSQPRMPAPLPYVPRYSPPKTSQPQRPEVPAQRYYTAPPNWGNALPRDGAAPRPHEPAAPRPQPAPAAPVSAPALAHPPNRGNAPPRDGAPSASKPPARRALVLEPPRRDDRGRELPARVSENPTRQAQLVRSSVANPAVVRGVQAALQTPANQDGKYHWYEQSGVRYSHRYDSRTDRNWFGFYRDNRLLWTVYWKDHFWWQEPRRRLWLSYWHDHWWWHSPQGVYYVYIDDRYYQWTPNATGAVLLATLPPPEEPIGAPVAMPSDGAANGTVGVSAAPLLISANETMVVSGMPEYHYSADATRMVQIEGSELNAYLYDMTRTKPDGGGNVLLRYLGKGVAGVEFSDASHGAPLQIVLSVQDGKGAVQRVALDGNGNPLDGAAPAGSPLSDFGAPGPPGYDAPAGDLPPSDAPFADGV
ncbi:MAG TPA: hypothetical protein VNI01_13415 [Elusimicrobiota bacterium]|nr:hypothetical protein [Elusimicrobiota bacterium]